MIDFEQEEFEKLSAKIKVIGVGGAGGNAVRRMIEAGLTGIEFYAVNTDQQALSTCHGATSVPIGTSTTKGLGAGANPEIGRRAADEDRECLQEIVDSANMVFVAAGMGGGTGTGAAPVVASLAKEKGALTIGVVTRPFNFEGRHRAEKAETGLRELRDSADSVIVVPNQRLIDTIDRKLPIPEAFKIGDEILLHGVQSISDIITESGEINVDFADVETVMRDAGTALMGMGRATGDNRAQAAAAAAISSPLLEETSISGAVGMIVNITSPPDFTMHELDEAMQVIVEASADAQPIFGLVYKDELELNEEVLVTVIATGFDPPSDSAYVSSQSGRLNPQGENVQGGQPNPMLQGSRVRNTETGTAGRTQQGTQRPAWDRQPQGRRNEGTSGAASHLPANRQRTSPQQVGQEKPEEDDSETNDEQNQNREKQWDIPAFLRVQQRRDKRRN
ncbi:cell division protein FtsZ [Candidatus Poribacteria bacterium]|nr:cell division protein FtsZ [Candidatus Poribacteria bacterium]